MNRLLTLHLSATSAMVVFGEYLLIILNSKDIVLLLLLLAYVLALVSLYEKHKRINDVEWKVKNLFFIKQPASSKPGIRDLSLIIISCVIGSFLGLLLVENNVDLESYIDIYLLFVLPAIWLIDSVSITWSYIEKRL